MSQTTDQNSEKYVAFQGSPGAYSDLACRNFFPDLPSVPCSTFEDAFATVTDGRADYAMIPIDNTLAGRVADVHYLMSQTGLHIIGEHFQPIDHCLLGLPGAKIEELKRVHSHVHALPQCREFIRAHKLQPFVYQDTAGSASKVAQDGNPEHAAIASAIAADIYGLEVLKTSIQDDNSNTTRFIVLAREELACDVQDHNKLMTSFVFEVRNIPAALYKAMGGFATNGINMTKLESYIGHDFNAAQFYCEVVGHPDNPALKLALEELGFFAKHVRIFGTYPAHEFRNLK